MRTKRLIIFWTRFAPGAVKGSIPFSYPLRMDALAGKRTSRSASDQPASCHPGMIHEEAREPLPLWMVRVWEREGPEEEDPLEWILLTSVSVTHHEQAWQCVDWYRCRWIVEDYHQCLKTVCRIEERQVQSIDRLSGIHAVA